MFLRLSIYGTYQSLGTCIGYGSRGVKNRFKREKYSRLFFQMKTRAADAARGQVFRTNGSGTVQAVFLCGVHLISFICGCSPAKAGEGAIGRGNDSDPCPALIGAEGTDVEVRDAQDGNLAGEVFIQINHGIGRIRFQ